MPIKRSPIEASLYDLIILCVPLVQYRMRTSSKWFEESRGQAVIKNAPNIGFAIVVGASFAKEAISKLPTFDKVKELYERDPVLQKGISDMPYYFQFGKFLEHLLVQGGSLNRGKITIDPKSSITAFRTIYSSLKSSQIDITIRARLIGVRLDTKRYEVGKNLKLYRLSKKERNDCAPLFEPIGFPDSTYAQNLIGESTVAVFNSKAEISFSKSTFAIQKAIDRAMGDCRSTFQLLVDAMLLTAPGKVYVGLLDWESPMSFGMRSISVPEAIGNGVKLKLTSDSLDQVSEYYKILTSDLGDRVLKSSFHRFVLSRKRKEVSDQVVDLVIAWEAFLQTVNGSPNMAELSYRFSLNGALIIARSKANSNYLEYFSAMKTAYSVRSTIVHGGSEATLNKAIETSKFTNIQELIRYLEENYRLVILWLLTMEKNRRPYLASGGWESLLWNSASIR